MSVAFPTAGLSTCHFAWAFHSEAEEELLNMIPAMQRGDPQWSELRAVGVGWWIRNINTLRKMVEKVEGHSENQFTAHLLTFRKSVTVVVQLAWLFVNRVA